LYTRRLKRRPNSSKPGFWSPRLLSSRPFGNYLSDRQPAARWEINLGQHASEIGTLLCQLRHFAQERPGHHGRPWLSSRPKTPGHDQWCRASNAHRQICKAPFPKADSLISQGSGRARIGAIRGRDQSSHKGLLVGAGFIFLAQALLLE